MIDIEAITAELRKSRDRWPLDPGRRFPDPFTVVLAPSPEAAEELARALSDGRVPGSIVAVPSINEVQVLQFGGAP